LDAEKVSDFGRGVWVLFDVQAIRLAGIKRAVWGAGHMDQETLLLEYLKHQWSERSFHQDGAIKVTAFLTAAAGVVLGLAFKEGASSSNALASGVVLFLIGLANLKINQAYLIGNRYRNSVSGKSRRALEKAIQKWTVETPTEIRKTILLAEGLNPDVSIGMKIHDALMGIPIATMIIGVILAAVFGLHLR
jgi:hypothetical protein